MVRFIVVMIIVSINLLSIKESYGKEYDFSYINPYKDEAMSYLKEGEISNVEKSINNYYFDCKELSDAEKDKYEKCKDEQSKIKKDAEHNKEQNYKSYELKKKGEEWVAQGGTTGEEMSESEKNAAEAFSYVQNNAGTNLAENSYTEINKDLNVISNEVTKNPMVRLNAKVKTAGGEEIEGTDCAVSDRNAEKDEVILEEYEKEEEETEIEDSEGSCEKDVEGPFYCEESLEEVGCLNKVNCGYNAGGIEEGSVDTGIDWDYTYPYLRLGSRTPDSSNEEDWHFRCGSRTCCDKKHRSARLRIKDLNNVKKFILHKISYDDYALVKINGVTVHNTLGGSYLDITRRYWGSDRDGDNDRIISSGAGSGPCWRLYPSNGFNHYDYVGKDVKHYLREGVNEIEIELVFAQLGQVNVVFEAEQYCCKKWGDGEWKGNCPK